MSTVHDSNFSSVGKWDPINTFNVKKYGRTTIGYLDERGVKVDEVKVTEIMTFSAATAALTVSKKGAIAALPTKEAVIEMMNR